MSIDAIFQAASNPNRLLHRTPLSVQLGMGVFELGYSITDRTRQNEWTGKVAHVVSDTLTCIGMIPAALISLIEGVALGAIAGFGLIFSFITFNKVEFLKRYTLQALSHSTHSFMFLIASIAFIFSSQFNTSSFVFKRTLNAALHHTVHIQSANLIQKLFGSFLGERISSAVNQLNDPSYTRTLSIIFDAAPNAISDLTRAVLLDLRNLAIEENINSLNHLRQVLSGRFPLHQSQILEAFQAIQQNNEVYSFQPVNSNALTTYQNHLQTLTKAAYREIYTTEALAAAFKEPVQEENRDSAQQATSGRESLETFSAHVFPLLCKWVQLKELEQEIQCPPNFGRAELEMYNYRKQMLLDAKGLYTNLNDGEKEFLKRRLLGLADPAPSIPPSTPSNVELLFRPIARLADPLLQSSLVSRRVSLQFGAGNGGVQIQNIFQEAMQQAQGEIQAAAPQS